MSDGSATRSSASTASSTEHRRIAVLAVSALLPFFAALFYFVLFADAPLARALYSGTKLFTVVFPLVTYRLIFREPLPPLRVRGDSPQQAVVYGVISGLMIVAALGILLLTPLRDVVFASGARIRAKAEGLGVLEHYLLFGLFLAVIHSLIEEYYWRWFLYGELRRVVRSRWAAHVVAALAFSLHHIVIATQFFPILIGIVFGLAVGVGGFVWSLLYSRFESVLAPWISHVIVDVGILGVGYSLLFGT